MPNKPAEVSVCRQYSLGSTSFNGRVERTRREFKVFSQQRWRTVQSLSTIRTANMPRSPWARSPVLPLFATSLPLNTINFLIGKGNRVIIEVMYRWARQCPWRKVILQLQRLKFTKSRKLATLPRGATVWTMLLPRVGEPYFSGLVSGSYFSLAVPLHLLLFKCLHRRIQLDKRLDIERLPCLVASTE